MQQAAPFIREIIQREASSSSISQDLSAEQFTLAKEAEQRERGADLITIDSRDAGGGAEGAYRPKVATWGVFPRPSNISREYGGGRTIRPGEVTINSHCKCWWPHPSLVNDARQLHQACIHVALCMGGVLISNDSL